MIRLTQGNLNNNHVYLRGHLGFFSTDTIGAANARDGQGTLLTVRFAGLPEAVETDIAGGKHLFRRRGPLCTPWPPAGRQRRHRAAIRIRVPRGSLSLTRPGSGR